MTETLPSRAFHTSTTPGRRSLSISTTNLCSIIQQMAAIYSPDTSPTVPGAVPRSVRILATEFRYQTPSSSNIAPLRCERHAFENQVAISQLLKRRAQLSTAAEHTSNTSSETIRPLASENDQSIQPIHTRDQLESIASDGRLAHLAQLASTTFGPAGLVAAGQGYEHWHTAFQDMVENILEDGEDVLLNLPYIPIRDILTYTKDILGDIREARLVIPPTSLETMMGCPPSVDTENTPLTFSEAIWADIDFAASARKNQSPKQSLYTMYDVLRRIVEDSYRPSRNYDDVVWRKALHVCLIELTAHIKEIRARQPAWPLRQGCLQA